MPPAFVLLRLKVTCTNGRHFGRFGLRISVMWASCGSRLPFRVLHGMQEQTTFSHVVSPPLIARQDVIEIQVAAGRKHCRNTGRCSCRARKRCAG